MRGKGTFQIVVLEQPKGGDSYCREDWVTNVKFHSLLLKFSQVVYTYAKNACGFKPSEGKTVYHIGIVEDEPSDDVSIAIEAVGGPHYIAIRLPSKGILPKTPQEEKVMDSILKMAGDIIELGTVHAKGGCSLMLITATVDSNHEPNGVKELFMEKEIAD